MVRFWNVQRWQEIHRLAPIQEYDGGSLTALSCNPTGPLFSLGTDKGRIFLVNISIQSSMKILGSHYGPVTALCLGSNLLISSGADGSIRLWELLNINSHDLCVYRSVTLKSGSSAAIRSISLSTSQQVFISSDSDGCIHLWEVVSAELLAFYKGTKGPILDVIFSHNERWIIFANDQGLHLWEWQNEVPIRILTTRISIESLSLSPNDTLLACGNRNGSVELWDTISWNRLDTVEAHQGSVLVCIISEEKLISTGPDSSVKCWKITSDRQLLLQFETPPQLFLKDAIGEDISEISPTLKRIFKQQGVLLKKQGIVGIEQQSSMCISITQPEWYRHPHSIGKELLWTDSLVIASRLLEVVKEGVLDQVIASLEAGAEVGSRDENGNTPLHLALQKKTFKHSRSVAQIQCKSDYS